MKSAKVIRKDDPEGYAKAAKAQDEAFQIEVNTLNFLFLWLEQYSAALNPEQPSAEHASALEVLHYKLTVARSTIQNLNRAAKVIQQRREREQRGLYAI